MEVLKKRPITASNEEKVLIGKLKKQLEEYLSSTTHAISESAAETILKFADDEILLLKYIRGRKKDIRKSCDSIIRYAQVSCDIYRDLFPAKIPEQVRLVFDAKVVSVLRHADDDGRIIVKITTVGWDPTIFSFNDILIAGRYLVDGLMDYPSLFEKGVVVIINAENVQFSQIRQVTIPAITKFFNVFFRSYPIPVKGIYHVNYPRYAKSVYSIIKPFLPKKLTDRTIMSSDTNELHKRISTKILPASVGGCMSDEEALTPLSSLGIIEK